MGQDDERTPLLSKPSGCCGGKGGAGCCGGKGASSSLSPTAGGASVPLKRNGNTSNSEGVWTIERRGSSSSLRSNRRRRVEDLLEDEEPLQSKCAASGGQCCKELKGDDERHLIPPEFVRDCIIGLADGLTVPFALTAGLSSLGNSTLVVTGGFAELCAGAISMGLGGFLASQAELDHFHYLRKQTHERVQRSCDGEMEREVHAILGPLGVKEALSRLVAEELLVVEDGACVAIEGVDHPDIENGITKEEKADPNVGLTAFLLKFGEGMEEVPRSRLWSSALTIGLSYFFGGLVPLLPYMFTETAESGLLWSVIVTGIVLFLFGGAKTYFTGATGGYRGYLWGAVSMTLVGGFAAAAAFGLVEVMGITE
ncbi:hypothetical protein CspHIS471_0309920 [Cutaneotrichosporon sp. HIS471]|nr:hypothetical protein CspHIS471_0309920 [Cutaneotrichosporon sp. HIS471]